MKFKVQSSEFKSPLSWTALCISACLLLFATAARAEIKVIEADAAYAMGDNDSKVDARRIATQEAKRKALEQAGTYVASLTQVKEYRLTKDEVTAYTAGILETDIIADESRGSASKPELYIKVRCKIDTAVLLAQIDQYRENEELRDQIEDAAKQQAELKKERDELVRQLAAEKDKAKAAETQKKLANVLTSEETGEQTNRAWARTASQVDLYSGSEVNRGVKLADLEDSADALEQTVQTNPGNVQSAVLLSALYEQKDDRKRAEEVLRSAISRNPGNPFLHLRLGIVLREQGRNTEALKEFRVMEQKRPNQPNLLFQLGLTHKANGNCRLASGYMKRFLMYTKRIDKPRINALKPKAREIVEKCGDFPPERRARKHSRP
ncbi:MAG: tetratricopeptide repeat protein [Nitrospiraceae bacterium]|nr:tetratricopeptide repeat protein [Nitrospiraceae bacterium]